MNDRHRSLLLLSLGLLIACKSEQAGDGAAEADKKAFEKAASVMKQASARMAAYQPHLALPESKEKYAWTRGADAAKAAMFAANEVRHAANEARQKIETGAAPVTKPLVEALGNLSSQCTDAAEPPALEKCKAALKALDDVLAKTSVPGVTGKLPRIAPESVTPEATAAMAPFLKVKGPTAGEKTFAQKRADPAASVADVISACQAAAGEVSDIASQFEKADEPIRLIGVTHKMSIEAQCAGLTTADNVRSELEVCKKKKKSTECSIACGKAKNLLEQGLPAAAFTPIEKEHGDSCSK
jgi:hypothetical protein